MKFPATRSQLAEGKWIFKFARPCKRCHAQLEFYLTPAKNLAPLEAVIRGSSWVFVSHFLTCPFRDEFKRPKEPQVPINQGKLF